MNKEYEIQIEIENQCYLDCLHCSSLSMRKTMSKLMEEELDGFLRLFSFPVHVYFSGGEPLANPNLNSFIKLVKSISKYNKVGIFTCGILKNGASIDMSSIKELQRNGLDDCYISLYHSIPEKHDQITNRRGSYCSTIQSIRQLREQKIDVKVHLVINRFNYESLDEVIHNILRLGVSQVRLLRMVKTGAAEINWNKIGVSYERQNHVIKEIIKYIERYSGSVTVSGFPTDAACRPDPQAIKCQAGTHLLYVTNSKQVFPCACTKSNSLFKIGSVCDVNALQQYLKAQQHLLCNEDCLNPIVD